MATCHLFFRGDHPYKQETHFYAKSFPLEDVLRELFPDYDNPENVDFSHKLCMSREKSQKDELCGFCHKNVHGSTLSWFPFSILQQ